MKKPNIDIVVAIRNEEEYIQKFVNSINELSIENVNISIVFVEDGSTDRTVDVIRDIIKMQNNVTYYSLNNPYGQGGALSFGIINSRADAVIIMDGDGSHPVETIIQMINLFLAGNNVIQGHRLMYKRENILRKYFSFVFFMMFTLFTGINLLKQNVHFRLMDRKAIKIYLQHKRWWYSVILDFKQNIGIKIRYINFIAPERSVGISKFNFIRLVETAFYLCYNMISVPRFILLNLFLLIIAIMWYNVMISTVLIFCITMNIFLFFYLYKDIMKEIDLKEHG